MAVFADARSSSDDYFAIAMALKRPGRESCRLILSPAVAPHHSCQPAGQPGLHPAAPGHATRADSAQRYRAGIAAPLDPAARPGREAAAAPGWSSVVASARQGRLS